jgi:hypothetical protein
LSEVISFRFVESILKLSFSNSGVFSIVSLDSFLSHFCNASKSKVFSGVSSQSTSDCALAAVSIVNDDVNSIGGVMVN